MTASQATELTDVQSVALMNRLRDMGYPVIQFSTMQGVVTRCHAYGEHKQIVGEGKSYLGALADALRKAEQPTQTEGVNQPTKGGVQ